MQTGDGKNFKADQVYFFFDRQYRSIYGACWSDNQRREEYGSVMWVGSHIPARLLFENKNDAIEDGKRWLLSKINEMENEIKELEKLKI